MTNNERGPIDLPSKIAGDVESSTDTKVRSGMLESLEVLIFEAVGLTAAVLAEIDMADLTLAQWRLLVIVGRENGVRVGRISTLMSSSQASTSRLVSRLERRGYLVTERDEKDRRATLVHLTPEGSRLRETILDVRRRKLADAISPGSDLPDRLNEGLAELAQRLSGYS